MPNPISYDEDALVRRLNALSPRARAAFAALAAERLTPGVAGVAINGQPLQVALSELLDAAWSRLGTSGVEASIRHLIDRCMKLLPPEPEEWAGPFPYAEDSVAAVAYLLRCIDNGLAQEAVWAARRGHEAIDRFVVRRDNLDLSSPGVERRVLADPLVQEELRAQVRDLDDLDRSDTTTSFLALRNRARDAAHTYLSR